MRTTVLIANYNYGRYLKDAIESALTQTVEPQCICIVDDNSTDDSWEIITSYCENNQREEQVVPSPGGNILVKLGNIGETDLLGVKLPQTSGPSVARNVGIQFTLPVTNIYAILDADDCMRPNKLEKCLKPFEDERIGVVYANYYNINEDTGVSLLEVKEPYSIERLQNECIVHSGALIRAEALDRVKDNMGWYDSSMRTCEDYELWIRLSNVCMFYHIAEALTDVLVHKENSTNSVKNEIWQRNSAYIRSKHGNSN